VDIQVPLFKDANTPEFAQTAITSGEKGPANLPEGYKLEPDTNIHMDAMGFGMGMCCLVRTNFSCPQNSGRQVSLRDDQLMKYDIIIHRASH
jgi:hypothetical protein